MKKLRTLITLLSLTLFLTAGNWFFIGTTAAPFIPTDKAGCQVWFRYDSLSTSGSTILSLLDKTINGLNLTFNTVPTNRQATLSSGTGPNGHDEIVFNGDSGGNFLSGSNIVTQTGGMTLGIVWQSDSPVTNNPQLVNIATDVSSQEFRFQIVPAVPGIPYLALGLLGQQTNGVGFTGYGSYVTTLHSLIIQYNGAGADTPSNWTVTINGVDQSLTNGTIPLNTTLGAQTSWGTPGVGTSGFNPAGKQYDFVIYNSVLTGPEKTGLLSYYSAQYGI